MISTNRVLISLSKEWKARYNSSVFKCIPLLISEQHTHVMTMVSETAFKISVWYAYIISIYLTQFHYTATLFHTVYPKKNAHGFCFAVLCCGYTLTDFPISIRLTSLAMWQSNDCPSASKATLMNMDKYFMWIHYERLHNHNKAKHDKTVCIFLGIYCNSAIVVNIINGGKLATSIKSQMWC